MKRMFLLALTFLFYGISYTTISAQNLNIISTGQTTSPGTNWSISGTTLTVTGTANIRASVIVNALANGNLSVVGNTTNFAVTISEAIIATSNNTLTVGSATNTGTITFSAVTSFAGPINIYGGVVNINGTLTSSANGDILLKGISNTSPCVTISSSGGITKSAGTGTLTIQSHGRINNDGSITASGTGIMNIIFWSDFDGDNVGGGVSHNGTISTNGGHVWMGGSNSNGGSYTWNSLAVGDGPSVGAASSNANALDIFGNITTSGGDFLAWAGNGVSSGINGIGTNVGYSVNVGSGDIILITDVILGTGPSLFFNQSGGSFTLVPNDGSFGTTFNWDGVTNPISGYGTGWNFSGNFNYLWLENPASLTSLTIGKYEGMLNGSTPVVLSNSSDVTFSNTTATSIAGPISIYGGDITVSQNLTSSLADADIILQATGAIILSASRTLQTSGGDVTLNATSGGTATTAQSAIYLNGSSQILSNGGNITLGGGYSGTEGNLYAATTISGIGYAVRMDAATVLNAAGAAAGGNINVYGRKLLSYGDGVYLNSVNISTMGYGTIGIYGDAFGGYNGTTYFGGITFENQASTIQTVNGNLTLKGILTNSQSTDGYGINFYRTTGSTGLTRHIQLLSRTGAIEVTGDAGSTIGGGIGSSSWGNVYFGSPADASFTATGDVTMSYSKLVGANANGFKVKTTGDVSYLPTGTSFTAAQTIPQNANYILADGASSLTIGKTTNTSDITMATSTTVAGPISVYGGAITFSQNLSTTNTTTGNILLNGTTISGAGNIAIAAGRTATLNVSSNSTYDGIVSGSGSGLTKSGIGMLTLTKDHTYSGATTLTAGDLQVGTGGSVSQASSGSISNTSAVAVASGSKLILTPNENIIFAAPISGAGGVEIKGASGAYYNLFLTGTAATIASNSTVLEVLTRITGGMQQGSAITGSQVAGTYHKIYNASNNTATFQFQQFEGTYTKCVFAQLTQSGINVQIRANTAIYNGAAYRSGNQLGADLSSSSLQMGLATCASCPGYGISNVYMSGKVNFTGNLTYSGNTILSNTVTNVTSPNTYTYTSKGTQEITDASSSFPPTSTVINNGLVIFNRATPSTISSDMQGTEEVLQVGAAITLTGTNTHTGITTIDLNKSLLIGNGSTSGSITGNIINYGTLTFNRSDSSSYTGIVSGSGALVKSGADAFTLTGLNTYTGATTINGGRLILHRDVPATSSSSYSGEGKLVIQPNSNSFTSPVVYPIPGFIISSSIGGLTIGKPTNIANVSFTSSTTTAGPITVFGGEISLGIGINLTSTLATGDITLLGKSGFTTSANSGTTRGKIMTSGGGNIHINGDANNDNSGVLDIDWLTIDGTTGDILLEAATFNWSTGSGVTFPEIYGTGALTITPVASSNQSFSTAWVALFGIRSALNIGHESSIGAVDFIPCTNCNVTALNYTGTTLQVNGPITVYGGTASFNQNISSSASGTISLYANTLTIASDKTVTSNGQLIISPQNTSTTIGISGASGTLALPASYFSTNFTDGFSNIQIGRNEHTAAISSNAFTLLDNLTLLTSGSLTLGGKPILGTNSVTLGSAISSFSGMPNHYFQTNGTGEVIRNVSHASTLQFPIGNSSYNPVSIKNNSGSSDNFSVRVLDIIENNPNLSAIKHVNRTWDISKTNNNAGTGIDFTFNWNAGEIVNGPLSNPTLNHYGTYWETAIGSGTAGAGSPILSLTHTGYTGTFSPFAISDASTPLPVSLAFFNLKCNEDNVELYWQTASEHHSSHFVVERSADGIEWEKLGEVAAAGNSTSILNYSFIDVSLLARTTSYYRLIQIDFDGENETYGPLSSTCEAINAFELVVSPNPSAGKFSLKIDTKRSQEIDVKIYHTSGKEMANEIISAAEGTSLHYLNMEHLASGIYTLRAQHKGGTISKKIVIL